MALPKKKTVETPKVHEIEPAREGELLEGIEPIRQERVIQGHCLKPFLHQALLADLEKAAVVRKSDMVNRINYLHFTEGPLYLSLQHTDYREDFLLPLRPDPCDGDSCKCELPVAREKIFDNYTINYLFVPNGHTMLIVPADVLSLDKSWIELQLPQKGYKVNHRDNQRYDCRRLSAALCQNAFQAKGALVDFSPIGMGIQLSPESISSMRWFNPDIPVLLRLHNDQSAVYTSMCLCIRLDHRSPGQMHLVLSPGNKQGRQFSKQIVRNPRQHFSHAFSVRFQHPFFGAKVTRRIHDITTSGFSVLEDVEESVLIPGLLLEDLTIVYTGGFELKCLTSQVIYRTVVEKGKVRCGVAILDMDINSYTKLANILTQSLDPHAQISSEVDLDDLWDFFFESGFIYPQKYSDIQINRSEFKETYQKLYTRNPDIARHFTYQKSGRIFGHISLVRAYEKTWMFHHLLAKSMNGRRTGPMVMKQITHFTLDMHRLPSANMDYMMCYYQPGNRFSNYVFGGFAQHVDDPSICSQDLLSYIAIPNDEKPGTLPSGWCLDLFSPTDIFELGQYYEHVSGGLMLEVLRLDAENRVDADFERCGFLRHKRAYSLLNNGLLKAVLLVNQTDVGLNLSNLLNCIKVIICDPEDLPWEILHTAVRQLMPVFSADNVPVLLYPPDYYQKQTGAPPAKEYQMWIINARHVGDFMAATKKTSKIGHWE